MNRRQFLPLMAMPLASKIPTPKKELQCYANDDMDTLLIRYIFSQPPSTLCQWGSVDRATEEFASACLNGQVPGVWWE